MRTALPPPSLDERSDDELMQLARVGQRRAYEALVRRHQRSVRAYCARWCGSAVLGDDLAQECFVELWRRRESYVAEGKLKAYLFRIAANRCKNQQRAQGRERAATDASAAGADAHQQPPSSDRFLLRERTERLRHELAKLPEPQREAVLLRYSAELDYAEIAELLQVPEATLRSRVFLGLMKLRRLLRAEKKS